jgi:hypothetical protein
VCRCVCLEKNAYKWEDAHQVHTSAHNIQDCVFGNCVSLPECVYLPAVDSPVCHLDGKDCLLCSCLCASATSLLSTTRHRQLPTHTRTHSFIGHIIGAFYAHAISFTVLRGGKTYTIKSLRAAIRVVDGTCFNENIVCPIGYVENTKQQWEQPSTACVDLLCRFTTLDYES